MDKSMNEKKDFNEAYIKMLSKSSVDETFRNKLKKNPVEVIETELGTKLPAHFSIKVIEPDPDYSLTFLLPSDKADNACKEIENLGMRDFLQAVPVITHIITTLSDPSVKVAEKVNK